MSIALKVALGILCFVIGAACVIEAIYTVPFVSASDAAIPATVGAFFPAAAPSALA
jgi:hypothetical protein